MAQSVGVDALVLKTSALGGSLTGIPKNLRGDRMTRCTPSVAGKQPVDGLALQPAPVGAQGIQQLRTSRIDLRYFGLDPCSRNGFNARSYPLESSFVLVP